MYKRSLPLTALCLLLAALLALSGCQINGPPEVEAPVAPPESLPASRPEPPPEAPSPPQKEEDEYEEEDIYPPHGDFLWEVKGGKGSVYLMGTMHVLKSDYRLTPELVEIFDAADALAVEVNMLDFSNLADYFDYMYYTDGSTVLDHLSERGQEHLLNMIDAYGLDYISTVQYHATSLSSTFSGDIVENTDYTIAGVDMLLLLRANDQLKPIYNLEDYRDYCSKMNALPDDTLERVCVLTIPAPDVMEANLNELYEVYLSGDEELVLELLNREEALGGDGLPIPFEDKDELYGVYMLDDRNRIMADSVISYLESGENVFVAAGLAHFIGENSIIQFLTEAGYQVVRAAPRGDLDMAA